MTVWRVIDSLWILVFGPSFEAEISHTKQECYVLEKRRELNIKNYSFFLSICFACPGKQPIDFIM